MLDSNEWAKMFGDDIGMHGRKKKSPEFGEMCFPAGQDFSGY